MMNKVLDSLILGSLLFSLMGLVPGCSVVMEATRPTPVRLKQFQPGESRSEVLEKLGQPVTTDGASCDLYSLVLRGYGGGAKAGIAFGEFAADVLTFGIAEVASTPTELATRNSEKTPVWFCYKKDALARVTRNSLHPAAVASSGHAPLTFTAGAAAPPEAQTMSASNAAPVAGTSSVAPAVLVAPASSPSTAANAASVTTAAAPANPTLAPASAPMPAAPENEQTE